jgi:hypothetical protein
VTSLIVAGINMNLLFSAKKISTAKPLLSPHQHFSLNADGKKIGLHG